MKRIFALFFFIFSILSIHAGAQYRKIVTIAGIGGIGGYGGDGFAATAGNFNSPQDVKADRWGNVYIVDFYNYRIRKIKTSGQLVTFAGNGTYTYTGDSTDATTAGVAPRGVAPDFRGNVYISDPIHSVIRKVNTIGIISTYAGIGVGGYGPDTVHAKLAKLSAPFGMACDARGNLYFADAGNHMIRMIDTFGNIRRIAGNGTPGYSGDGFPAVDAQLDSPYAVAVDRNGVLYIADHQNNVIRMVDLTGNIYTIAGTGALGYTGDGGLAVTATFNYPTGIAVDTFGNIYISDSYNNAIRMIDTAKNINLFAGNTYPGFGGDLGGPLGANLYHPYGVDVDAYGSVFIADVNNQRIRKVYITTVGINDVNSSREVEAYPNPFVHEIVVSGLVMSDKVCVYDLAGRAVGETWTASNDGEETFKINDLAPGMYLLRVSDAAGNTKATIKMTK